MYILINVHDTNKYAYDVIVFQRVLGIALLAHRYNVMVILCMAIRMVPFVAIN